jgi:hypothetical protein
MRYPAIDMDLSLNGPFAGRPAQRPSILARIHWPRVIALLVILGIWPAIIFAVSRFF